MLQGPAFNKVEREGTCCGGISNDNKSGTGPRFSIHLEAKETSIGRVIAGDSQGDRVPVRHIINRDSNLAVSKLIRFISLKNTYLI